MQSDKERERKDFGRIPVTGPSITQKEIDYVCEAVRSAWYERAYTYQVKFEEAFSKYVGTRYAISLPSCTSALHLALSALDIKAGDEVIVPDITWIGTAAPVSYVGATPVFADIDSKSWCICAQSIEENISSRTKAIIIVDLYGNIPDMDAIRRLSRKYGIPIIEDAAQALGSEYKGRKAGALADIGVFSFHGTKVVTTGEGGMLVTDHEDIYRRCSVLRDHGRKPNDRLFWNSEVAFKYRMTDMQAALGLAQLERIDELLDMKKRIFTWYQKRLKGMNGLHISTEPEGVKSSCWMTTLAWDKSFGMTKEEVMERLKERNIDARPFFYPLSMLPAYRDICRGKDYPLLNRSAYTISPYAVNLPSGTNMTEELVEHVCDAVCEIVKKTAGSID